MPINYQDYAPNWKTEIRPRILTRAKNRCEQCGLENYSHIIRHKRYPEVCLIYDPDEMAYRLRGELVRLSELPDGFDDRPEIRVILTIAHLDHDKSNNADDNLKALCQRCHLIHDKTQHTQNAKKTRTKTYHATIQANGQLELFGEES